MENEFYFTDSNGNKIDDFKKFFAENPEIFDKFKKLNLRENPFEKYEWLIRYGCFKTAIEYFYRECLENLEKNKERANVKDLLINQFAPERMIYEFERLQYLHPELQSDIGFAISTMKSLQNAIGIHLKVLEQKKVTKQKEVIKILAFKNDVTESLSYLEIILDNINSVLFENSIIQDWEQLLQGIVLENPIVIKDNVTIKDLKYFITSLQRKILKGRIYTDLENINAFIYKGSKLRAKQIQKVDDTIEPKLKDKIDKIISFLE
jgi:hypothetical protein